MQFCLCGQTVVRRTNEWLPQLQTQPAQTTLTCSSASVVKLYLQQMDAGAHLRFPARPFHHYGVHHHITACSPKGPQNNHCNSHGGRLHNGGKRCPRDCACTVTTGPLLVMGATSIQGVTNFGLGTAFCLRAQGCRVRSLLMELNAKPTTTDLLSYLCVCFVP